MFLKRPRITALRCLSVIKIPAEFEQQITRIKTKCNNFVNKKSKAALSALDLMIILQCVRP